MKKIISKFSTTIKDQDVTFQTKIVYIIAAVISAAALVVLLWFIYRSFQMDMPSNGIISLEHADEQTAFGDDCTTRHPINGRCLDQGQELPKGIVAIMVENHIEAQPLAGIAQARLVYEAPVEGSIPRLLAVYDVDQEVLKVGPVRSARPYYLDWLQEYGQPMYMHVGGSPDALDIISQRKLFDLNEFYRGWFYWRSTDRYAPHNTYTSSELWQGAYARYAPSGTIDMPEAWRFQDMEACKQDCTGAEVFIHYGGAYRVQWTFNSSTNQYERYQFRRRHRDQDGTPYVAKSILIQEVRAEVLDAVGRLGIETIGEGNGYVLRNGQAIAADWKKESLSDKTRWYDKDTGEEITLQPGTIWVEVVSQFNDISFEQ